MRASVLAIVLVVGCGFAEDEVTPPPPVDDTQDHQDPNQNQDSPQGKTATPIVDPISSSACGDSVPVQGTAVPGVSVVVFGGLSGISTDAHPVTGRFCLDVPLKQGSNTLEVRAQDPALDLSDPSIVNVNYTECGDDVTNPSDPQPTPKNVALGATVTSSDDPKQNNGTFMVDGDSTSWVEFGGNSADSIWGWSDYNGWVMVKLDKMVEVDKIVVRWRDDTNDGDKYATQYKILVTSQGSPTDPNTTNGLWQEVGAIADGDGGNDEFNLIAPLPLVTHVALYLQQDGKPHWKENIGIPFDGSKYEERFAIGELEIRESVKSQPGAPPPAFTCTSLGSF